MRDADDEGEGVDSADIGGNVYMSIALAVTVKARGRHGGLFDFVVYDSGIS
jgi:hypothetical protein